jgi:spermidine/putrescine ABC transporter ATP-binding subunit
MTTAAAAHPQHIRIEGVSKRFGDVTAVRDIDLTIGRGELFALLGGSGCGKTTLLRMLAGFAPPTTGRIIIGERDVTAMPPYERPVNMMFQSYALFPHMTVQDNIAFGLRRERVEKHEVGRRVAEAMALVKMEGLERRKPAQLSGGQRQRVALARAVVKKPEVLLLDEPMSALDKKLRAHTQFELSAIQRQLGITFVMVTHGQEEAMAMATRIAVMEAGRIMQVGPPQEIYEQPRNRFVADFIGTVNLLDGTVASAAVDHVVREAGPNGPPSELRTDGIVQPVIWWDGPDRIEPEWWHTDTDERGGREYYRVELASGARLWAGRTIGQQSHGPPDGSFMATSHDCFRGTGRPDEFLPARARIPSRRDGRGRRSTRACRHRHL